MTTTMTMTTTSRSADCGCGGGGVGDDGGGCNCGGSPAVGSAAFTRPRFFAGQLLTEDDLEQLTAYITGKDRLRNRMLFGPGVVSGLHVVCGPCGGDIVVRPGYALDCCGNEIVVSCPETVSITELVNELRVRGLGVDCGDPCADRSTSGEDQGHWRARHPRPAIRLVCALRRGRQPNRSRRTPPRSHARRSAASRPGSGRGSPSW